MSIKTIENMGDLTGKTVLLRADFNVPLKDGVITDDTRIKATIPTIEALLEKNARIIILSHLGRPKGQKNPDYSLKPIATALSKLLDKDVAFENDCLNTPADNQITLMENLRFHAEEEANDNGFAKKLASLGDIYINDAFSTSHRAHASTHALAKMFSAYAGCLMYKEINALNTAFDNPERPVAAIVGGAKVSTKLDVLNHLIEKVDILVLGGGMANTFIAARGINVGKSLQEKDMHDIAINILDKAKKLGCRIVLPVDAVIAGTLAENVTIDKVEIDDIPADKMMLDIGDISIASVVTALEDCKTVLWNGPMGAFEIKPFDNGTNTIAKYVAKRTKENTLTSIAGGGDTVSALAVSGAKDDFSYVSTAGGAFLEWIEGKTLPAIAVLEAA